VPLLLWICVGCCSGRNEATDAADRERFLQELEEDAEMRARVALFKDPAALAAAAAAGTRMVETDDSDDDGDLPQVGNMWCMPCAVFAVCFSCLLRKHDHPQLLLWHAACTVPLDSPCAIKYCF
jgi:hypothetical protein